MTSENMYLKVPLYFHTQEQLIFYSVYSFWPSFVNFNFFVYFCLLLFIFNLLLYNFELSSVYFQLSFLDYRPLCSIFDLLLLILDLFVLFSTFFSWLSSLFDSLLPKQEKPLSVEVELKLKNRHCYLSHSRPNTKQSKCQPNKTFLRNISSASFFSRLFFHKQSHITNLLNFVAMYVELQWK